MRVARGSISSLILLFGVSLAGCGHLEQIARPAGSAPGEVARSGQVAMLEPEGPPLADPGIDLAADPSRKPAYDLTAYSAPRITAGRAKVLKKNGGLAELTATRAYRATVGAPLSRLYDATGDGVTPGNLIAGRTWVAEHEGVYSFTYVGADCQVVYRYRPATGTLNDLMVQVDDGVPFYPAWGGGARVAGFEQPGAYGLLRGGNSVALASDGKTVKASWEYPRGASVVRIEWRLTLQGKALRVTVDSNDPAIEGFSLGQVALVSLRRAITVPYLAGTVDYLPGPNLYCNRYLDWTRTGGSQCTQGNSVYDCRTDGRRQPLSESGFIAVSPDVREVLPGIPHPPSSWVGSLSSLVVLDLWGHQTGGFAADADYLRELKDNGIDHLAVILHQWQCYGYDVKYPDVLPASAGLGGNAGLAALGKAARDCGYLFALHENYVDYYPDAPSYDPAERALRVDGTPAPSWRNPDTGVQSFTLKANAALKFAQRNAPEMHRLFATSADYLDANTSSVPWQQLDHDATQPNAALMRGNIDAYGKLMDLLRAVHRGPLLGEGGLHFLWAGRCDGVEAQEPNGENAILCPDFDLLQLHPRMVNHGMGYYGRFFPKAREDLRWTRTIALPELIDHYRAMEVAFGHAGYIGSSLSRKVQWVAREHHLVYPIERLAGAAKPLEIMYEVDGRFVTASVALALAACNRVRVHYDSGLTVWVNGSDAPWTVEGRTLPRWGFLARGPQTEVGYVTQDGRDVTYAACPEYVFADARTAPLTGGAMLRIEPRLTKFEDLGGGRVRVAYDWVVDESPDQDYLCYVHLLDAQGRIIGQQDHPLARPTGAWRAGDVVHDGPYVIQLPAAVGESCDIGMGLYSRASGRQTLQGPLLGERRTFLGRLRVERRADGAIGAVRLMNDQEARAQVKLAPPLPESPHNPAGSWVDGEAVRTDGCVKVERGPRGVTIYPYPRNRAFSVALDPRALAPEGISASARPRVRSLAAGNRRDLGEPPTRQDGGWLVVQLGQADAGCYTVEW